MRALPALLVAVLLCTAARPLAAVPEHPMIPGRAAVLVNPALTAREMGYIRPRGIGMPMGLLGLLVPERNPFTYRTDPETFRSRFDGFQLAEQLARPYTYLIAPPASPEEVELSVARDRLQFTTDSGSPIALSPRDRRLPAAMTMYWQPPLAALSTSRIGGGEIGEGWTGEGALLRGSLALHLGGRGPTARPNAAAAALLAGRPVRPEERYEVSVNAAAGLGIEASITGSSRYPDPHSSALTVLAGRLSLHYTGAYATGALRASVTPGGAEATGENGNSGTGDGQGETAAPGATDAGWRAFYLYPGIGHGLGGRLDVGTATKRRGFTYGMSVAGLIAAEQLRGRAITDARPEPHAAAEEIFVPAALVVAHVAQEIGRHVTLYGDVGYESRATGHLGAEVTVKPVTLRVTLGLGGAWDARLAAELPLRRTTVIVAATVERALLVRKQLVGLQLRLKAGGRSGNAGP